MISKVKNYLNTQKEVSYLKKYFSNLKIEDNGTEDDRTFVFYVGIGGVFLSHFEILFYHLIKSHGKKVKYYIYDDRTLYHETITQPVIDKGDLAGTVKKWTKKILDKLKAANVDYEFIDVDLAQNIKLPDTREELYHFTYDGFDFGNIIQGVLYRTVRSLDISQIPLEIVKGFLKTTIVNYLNAQKIHKENGHCKFLFSHGIYCTWEPVVLYCEKNEIEYISYDRAKTKNHLTFNHNRPAPDWSFNNKWEEYKDRGLSSSEEAWVDQYWKDRELQLGDVFAFNLAKSTGDVNELKAKYRIPETSKTVTLFTNLIWDAANVSRDVSFQGILECIIETIDRYKDKEGIHLCIRSHPAEMIIGTKERYGNLIRDHYPEMPSNVTIIEPEDKINSFDVLKLTDIGVVNTSTVGLELAMIGKPVLLLSSTHYREKGFTHDIKSKDDYFEVLEHFLNNYKLDDNQITLARKYFYMMMKLYQKPIPLDIDAIGGGFYTKPFSDMRNDDIIKKIIDNIIKNQSEEFIFWD